MSVCDLPAASAARQRPANLLRELEVEILSHRPKTAAMMELLLGKAPHDPLAHAIKALALLIAGRSECRIAARECALAARTHVTDAARHRRARAYVCAAEAWGDGKMQVAADLLDEWIDGNPEDVLGLKFSTAIRFMAGDIRGILATTSRAIRRLSSDDFGYGYVLGCHAFALEELGEFDAAEKFGRNAVALEPSDAWGMHAVAHVYDMTAQPRRGISWLDLTRPAWSQCNNFAYHMEWHRSLLQLELGAVSDSAEAYDRRIRLSSTDDYRDIANAVSMLVRLEKFGFHAGNRWEELATIARRRTEDSTLVFAMLHYLIALVRVGDRKAMDNLLGTMRSLADTSSDQGRVAADVGIDLARAIAAPNAGQLRRSDIASLLDRAVIVGGSRVQREILSLWLCGRSCSHRTLDAAD